MYSLTKYKYINNIFISITLLISYSSVYSQLSESGTPFFTNYPPKKYGYENQNFWVVQGNDGICYFANTNGILEYDGHRWSLIPLPGIPRLTKTADGTVYASGFGDFGKLVKDEKNKTVFKSLINKNTKRFVNDINILKLETDGDNVYLNTGKNIYRWNNVQLQLYDSSDTYISAFGVKDKLYINDYSKGLFFSKNGKLLGYVIIVSLSLLLVRQHTKFGYSAVSSLPLI